MKRALACLAVLAALLPQTLAAQSPPPTKGSLTVAFGAEPTTLDPVRYAAGVDLYGVSQMFEQLIRPDANGKVVNWLAESWEITGTKEKPIIDVRIRPGVKFHNGDPVTAADFEFSYERLRDPKQSRWSFFQDAVERFEVVDDLRFKIHFKKPDAVYITNFLQLWAMPKRYFNEVGIDGFAKAPVGTGPWKFSSWKIKDELKLEAFDDYWNKTQRPTVKNLTIKFIPEDLTRVAAYKTGAVDMIDAVPLSALDEFAKLPNTTTQSMLSGNNLYMALPSHQENSPFRDVRVRQAAAIAVDMDAIIQKVLFGQGERYAEIGRGSFGYDPELKPYPYDPAKARRLLREAGFPNGFEVPCYNLITPREPNIKEMGEAFYAYLTAVGIRCKVVNLEYNAWINLGRRDTAQKPLDGVFSFMYGHGLPGDPGRPWNGHLHSYIKGTGYGGSSYTSDPEIDAMVEQQNEELDPAAREALLKKIARRKQETVGGGIATYRPKITFAWRTDKVTFTPWAWPGYWHGLQQIGVKE
jgi:peptide/nickel transport system substrate-binding protein